MADRYGVLVLADSARAYVNDVGQQLVFQTAQQYIAAHNADMQRAMTVFVEGMTEDHKLRYRLPGSGRLQRRASESQVGARKAAGQWDVAFPLEAFGDQVAGDRRTLAYLTLEEFQLQIDAVRIRHLNTVRFEMLKALFNNTQRTFVDPLYGSLLIEPLANADTVVYPPVLGSESEATDDHYLESGYAASAISDTNNPYATIRDELEEHFGVMSGGSNIVAFINNAQVAKTEDLTDYDPVNDRFVLPGADADTLTGLPAGTPGRVIGRTNGVWVVEWRFIPANYIVGIHLDAPKPLLKRVDPAAVGLGQGLQLAATDEIYPFTMYHYEDAFGFGVANRLNGVVMELGTGGTYGIPNGYS